MSFSCYKSISAVLQKIQIIYKETDFIIETRFNIPEYFKNDIQIVIGEGIVDNSEFAICENLIYPVGLRYLHVCEGSLNVGTRGTCPIGP